MFVTMTDDAQRFRQRRISKREYKDKQSGFYRFNPWRAMIQTRGDIKYYASGLNWQMKITPAGQRRISERWHSWLYILIFNCSTLKFVGHQAGCSASLMCFETAGAMACAIDRFSTSLKSDITYTACCPVSKYAKR